VQAMPQQGESQLARKAGCMMETWVKKDDPSITVEAVRLNEGNVLATAAWCMGEVVEEIDPFDPLETQDAINVITAEGPQRASLGMYVIKYGRQFLVSRVRPFEEVYTPERRDSPPPESIADSRRQRGFADPFDMGRFGP
jgi:hypothetical protein